MPDTRQTGKRPAAPPSKQIPSKQKPVPPKLGPKRFDPNEHGGVKPRGRLFFFFGVFLPVCAMLFEINFHFCARHFFDPFPSPWHVVLFALIPFSNYLVWLGTRHDLSNHYAFMSLISGMAMGVGCLYTLMFLPLTPMACLFTLAMGFGLLGLAPLLSLPCNWISGKTVCHLAARKITYFNAHQVEHLGHMIILVMVIAIELPSTLTRINLSRAADADVTVASDGVNWLRRYGSQEVLLRACYERSGRATDILGSLYESAHPLNVDEARRVFYQVTGKPFNSVPIPKSARATIQHTGAVDPSSPNAGVDDEFDLDTDIAGEAVSGVARGLSVKQSAISARVDGDAALASVDWTFSFNNESKYDREARAKILLPPRAVVTRATLTVFDVEREATIMVRSLARARYRRAVAEHKDPLLVSTCGPDELLVQCFPVRPGDSMKVRLQMAVPLEINDSEKAVLPMPAFMERNFQVEQSNTVDIESKQQVRISGIPDRASESRDSSGLWHTQFVLGAPQMAALNSLAEIERNKNCHAVWCQIDKILGKPSLVRNVEKRHFDGIKNLVVVVDGSAGMQPFMAQIAEGLRALPKTMTAEIWMVGDKFENIGGRTSSSSDGEYAAVLERLKNFAAAGGQDDFGILSQALNQAVSRPDDAVLWIHGVQPITRGSSSAIDAIMARAGGRPKLFDMQISAGPNEILNGLNDQSGIVRVSRAGSCSADLTGFLKACDPETAASSKAAQPIAAAPPITAAPPIAAAPPVVSGLNPPARLSAAPAATVAGVIRSGDFQFIPGHAASVPEKGAPVGNGPTATPAPKPAAAVNATTNALLSSVAEPAPVAGALKVDGRLAQIWANQQICEDSRLQDYSHKREASQLAEAFQIVSPVSSAVVSEAKTPVAKPKQIPFRAETPKPVAAFRNIVSAVRESKKEVVEKLAGVAGGFEKSKEMSFKSAVTDKLNSLSSAASAPPAANKDNFFDAKERDANLFETTSGTVGRSQEEGGKNAAPAEPSDMPAMQMKAIRLQNANQDEIAENEKAEVGHDQSAAPEAKVVPEADTWLLLMVIAFVLAGSFIANRRKQNTGKV